MSDYIINPFWIYLFDVLRDLDLWITILTVLIICVVVIIVFILAILYFSEHDDNYESDVKTLNRIKSILKKCIIFTIIGLILSCITPTERTMYTMFVGSYLTEENINTVGETVTDAVDYIFEKIDELED